MRDPLVIPPKQEAETRGDSVSPSELFSIFAFLLLLEILTNASRSHLINFILLLSGGTLTISANIWFVFLARMVGLGFVYCYLVLGKKKSIHSLGVRTDTVLEDFFFGLKASLYIGVVVISIVGLTYFIFEKDLLHLIFGSGLGKTFRTPQYFISYFIIATLFAPVVEEVIFRGILYPVLRRSLSWQIAVLSNATIFALAHSGSSGQAIVQFAGGLMFAALFEKRRSIVSPCIVHSLGNISIFLLQCFYL